MDNRRIIQESIDYIEDNLRTELTAQELADKAGFSLFHYYRLFQLATGMPLMQYIVRRKLLNAIYEISRGKKIIDAALEYGFDTHAGFYKAFKRELGCAPSVFMKRHKIRKPFKPNLFQKDMFMMTHKKISELLRFWNLENEPITDIYYENTGEQNHHAYYIGSSYVIKFTANLGELRKHISLSRALTDAGLTAAAPIDTVDGREYTEDNGIWCFVARRLSGSQINAEDLYSGDYHEKAYFVGQIIGKLHTALQNVDAVVDDMDLYDQVAGWAMPQAKRVMALPDNFCMDYTATFGELFAHLPKQIIHRDPNPGNIILCDDRWGFIDFDLSQRNIRIFDPCYAATAILSESLDEAAPGKLDKWLEIYHSIIRGYDSIVPMTPEERAAVPYVVLSIQLICVAWFSEQTNEPELFEINKKMTRWLVDSFAKLQID